MPALRDIVPLLAFAVAALAAVVPTVSTLVDGRPLTLYVLTIVVGATAGLGLALSLKTKPEEEVSVPSDGGAGLVIGVRPDRTIHRWLKEDQPKHGLIVGRPGAGKTQQLLSLFVQAVLRGRGAIFIDAKPSTWTLRLIVGLTKLAGRSTDLRVLRPGCPAESHTWNPLRGTVEQRVALLTELKKLRGTGATEYYQDAQAAMLTATLGVLDATGRPYSIGDLLACFTNLDAINEVLRYGPPSEAKSRLSAMLETYRTANGVDRFRNEMNGFASVLFQLAFSEGGSLLLSERGEIDLYDVVRKNQILYVAVPTATAGKNAWIWALLVVKSLMACMGRAIERGQAPRHTMLALLDELRAYLTEDAMLLFAQAREANVGVVAGLQSISQMRVHGEPLDAQVLDNTGFKAFYGQAGFQGAEAAAIQIGKSWQARESATVGTSDGRSQQPRGGGHTTTQSESVSWREVYDYDVPPEALLEQGVGELYLRDAGGTQRLRAPLVDVEDAELPEPRLLRYAHRCEDGIGLYDKYIRRRGNEQW